MVENVSLEEEQLNGFEDPLYNYTVIEEVLTINEIESIINTNNHKYKKHTISVKKGQKYKIITHIQYGKPIPKIDKFIFTIPCTEESHKETIKIIIKELLNDPSNHDKHLKISNKSSKYYQFSYDYYTPKSNHIGIQFSPHTVTNNYLRISFNPQKLIEFKEIDFLLKIIESLCLNGIDLDSINISRLDVCIDLPVPRQHVAFYVPKYSIAKTYNGKNNMAETEYVGADGSKITYIIYDKIKQVLSKNNAHEWIHIDKPMTRIEASIRNIKVSELNTIDPFEKPTVYAIPPPLKTPNHIWEMFLLSVQIKGLIATLASFPADEAKKYRDRLSESYAGWWDKKILLELYKVEIDNLLSLLSEIPKEI